MGQNFSIYSHRDRKVTKMISVISFLYHLVITLIKAEVCYEKLSFLYHLIITLIKAEVCYEKLILIGKLCLAKKFWLTSST